MSQTVSLSSEPSFSSRDLSTGEQTEMTAFGFQRQRCMRFLSLAETRRTGFNLQYKIPKMHALKAFYSD